MSRRLLTPRLLVVGSGLIVLGITGAALLRSNLGLAKDAPGLGQPPNRTDLAGTQVAIDPSWGATPLSTPAVLEAKPDQGATRAPASESVRVAETDSAPPSFEEKYKDKSVPDMVAARIQIEKQLALRNAEILGEMIKRGQCEVLTRKYGEATSPKMPVGWAARTESTSLDEGTEIVRLAMFDPRSQPDTEALVREAEWLAQKVDSSGGNRSMGSDHHPR